LKQVVSPESHDAYIQADASQIQECLINLSNNAVHAMNEQGELTFSLKRVQLKQKDIPKQNSCSPGDYQCLSVRDQGIGVPAEILENIFDPFFTTKELYEGTGMGLSTVQGIVKLHQGMVTVESTLGEGAVFSLYFPELDHQPTDVTEKQGVQLQRGTERILFVDDDEMVANLSQKMLAEMGYQVTMFTDSIEALKYFSANPDSFDLVMTDQTMPELTGKELIQKIKKIRPEVSTILCTGYSNRVNEEEARKAGVSAFLMKPVEFSELSLTIRDTLKNA
jgi:CheY-like chemotaxis protein